VIPAGTGHWFTKIDDHVNYLMIRIDPDGVTPLKSESQSKEYLSKPAPAVDNNGWSLFLSRRSRSDESSGSGSHRHRRQPDDRQRHFHSAVAGRRADRKPEPVRHL
jgi:hypothetical protein